jgi:hypothetical protein
MNINLDSVSGELDDRWDELSDLAINPGGSLADKVKRRKQIDLWQAKIIRQQNAIDEIKATKAAAKITVPGLTDAEVDEVRAALNSLNKQIQRDQVWSNTIDLVTEILAAASTVRSKAAA